VPIDRTLDNEIKQVNQISKESGRCHKNFKELLHNPNFSGYLVKFLITAIHLEKHVCTSLKEIII